MRKTDKHTFFFTDKDTFSNWHRASFAYHGINFNCVEQFMMYAKALTFKDLETAQKILATSDPKEQKRLGREVKNFDKAVWDSKCENVVYVANREKYKQNPHMLKTLLGTGNTTLVEASRYDKLWGIGMSEWDQGVDDPANWKGQNLLGKTLTKLRDDFVLYFKENPNKEKAYLEGQLTQAPKPTAAVNFESTEPAYGTYQAARPKMGGVRA